MGNINLTERYLRNKNAFGINGQALLAQKHVLIVGCGGLGGYVIEGLARAGIEHFTLCDPDIFEVTNLNRQLYALPSTLGKKKALIARERILDINDKAQVQAFTQNFEPFMLDGADIVVDCLGGPQYRLYLQEETHKKNLPLVSAGISGWSALISTSFPKEQGLGNLMSKATEQKKEPSEIQDGSPVCTVMFAASVQLAETIRLATNLTPALHKKILLANLSQARFQTISGK